MADAKCRKLLFLCVANAARSQMAEGLARAMAPPGVRVYSAGSEPGVLHPRAAAVLREVGVDISSQLAKPISEVPLDAVDTIVTLCAEEVCPVVPSGARRLHWPFEDPAAARGSEEEVRACFRRVRDGIRDRLRELFPDGP